MTNKVIKAYMALHHKDYRIPYMEKETIKDGLTIIVSIYKGGRGQGAYCLAVIVDKGEYLFSEGTTYSKQYSMEEVSTKDIPQMVTSEIVQNLIFRKKLLTFMSENPKLPSILSVAYNRRLLVYYLRDNVFAIATLNGNQLVINLPAPEQVYLTNLLGSMGIQVVRTPREVSKDNGFKRIGENLY